MEIYKDRSRPVAERVEDLLSRMTLEEKAAQLCGDLPASVLRNHPNLTVLLDHFAAPEADYSSTLIAPQSSRD